MVAAVPQTTNFALNKPPFDYKLYQDLVNANFDVIDAILNQYLAVQNVVGVWQNSTAYTVGQRVIDSIVGTIYNCNIPHTSSASPVLFSADRASNPTYWSSLSQAATARGAWTSGTQYQTNDFVSSGNIFAVAIDAHVSGVTFAGDSAHWSYLINLSSFTLPSGVGQALKYLRQNAGETSLEYVTPATVLAAINDPSILAQISAGNVFTGTNTFNNTVTVNAVALSIVNAALGDYLVAQSTDAGAAVGPDLVVDRFSASPAAADLIGRLIFRGRSSTGATRSYATAYAKILTATNATEDAELHLQTIIAGVLGDTLIIGKAGIYTPNATGTDKGADSINAKSYYIDGVSVAGRDNVNRIVNPNCAVAQLGTTVATVADNAYAGDGVRVLSEAAGDVTWTQGTNSSFIIQPDRYSDQLAVVTANNKFGLFRPIEGKDCYDYRSQSVIFSGVLYADASLSNCKAAILVWTGAEDAITADPISAWNGNGVNPTLIANWAYLNAPVNLNIPAATATAFSVTGGPVSTSMLNLALFVWNDDKTTTAAQIFAVSAWDIRKGNILMPFEPINFQSNLARCQRYFSKSFALATAPVQNVGTNNGSLTSIVAQAGITTWKYASGGAFPVPMRIAPTVTLYNPAAANAFARNTTRSTDATASSVFDVAELYWNFSVTGIAAWTVGDSLNIHYSASARL